jgi:hypothetical protein
MQVKFKKTGYVGIVSDRVAEVLEKRGDVEVLEVVGHTDEAEQKPDATKQKRGRS